MSNAQWFAVVVLGCVLALRLLWFSCHPESD